MSKPLVSIVRYEKPGESVRKAVELSKGLDKLPAGAKVFIKPNIVFWTKEVDFPKYGVITTSRVVEDMVVLLKERGIDDITIGEGCVSLKAKDADKMNHAFESLGYGKLKDRYGIKSVNVFERPYRTLDLGDDVVLNFNSDAVDSDFIVDLPVLKTHAQTVVSIGIKNLKGLIDIESRKKCHNADPGRDLNFYVSKLADGLPPIFTLADGIYTNERGPAMDGRMHRSNVLIASADVLSCDLVGSNVLGWAPEKVPHLVFAAKRQGRPMDLSDIEVVGEKIEDVAKYHEHAFPYNEDDTLPMPLVKKGIKGLSYKKYDLTMCTYCSSLTGIVLTSIAMAFDGTPFPDVEVLTGKVMQPTKGMKKTILLGKCMCDANEGHPDINELFMVKGCPPPPKLIVKALHEAGIKVDPNLFEHMDHMPGFFLPRYKDKPEFEPGHFSVV
jgi:uncharacterized protein (DUF362 family)